MQFLTESILTAGIAGIFGVLLAVWGLDLLKKVAENFIPRVLEISLDLNVLGFAVGLSLLTGLVLGLIPALHASRSDPIDSLKDSSRGTTGRQAGRLRAGLLVAEVALSLVLLVGAVLLIDSFRRLQTSIPVSGPKGSRRFSSACHPVRIRTSSVRVCSFRMQLRRSKRSPA